MKQGHEELLQLLTATLPSAGYMCKCSKTLVDCIALARKIHSDILCHSELNPKIMNVHSFLNQENRTDIFIWQKSIIRFQRNAEAMNVG